MPEAIGPDQRYSQWRLYALPAMLVATLVFGSGFARSAPVAPNFAYADKLAHFILYGLLGTLVFRALRRPFFSRRRWVVAFLVTMSLGIGEEILQSFNPLRSFEIADWMADTAGALVAIALYRNWRLYREALEYRLWPRLAKGKRDPYNGAS